MIAAQPPNSSPSRIHLPRLCSPLCAPFFRASQTPGGCAAVVLRLRAGVPTLLSATASLGGWGVDGVGLFVGTGCPHDLVCRRAMRGICTALLYFSLLHLSPLTSLPLTSHFSTSPLHTALRLCLTQRGTRNREQGTGNREQGTKNDDHSRTGGLTSGGAFQTWRWCGSTSGGTACGRWAGRRWAARARFRDRRCRRGRGRGGLRR